MLAGCAKPTEEQRLAKFRGSVKYKVYRLASEKVTRLAVAEYNKTTTRPISDRLVHATLGIIWFASEKSSYSFIEADIAGTGGTHDAGLVGLGLKSIALSKMKYPGLSKAHYDELKTLLASRQDTSANSIEIEHRLLLLSLIAVGLCHGDLDLARTGADALGAVSQLDYLPPLIGSVVEAKKGRPVAALAQLRELNKSERFSEHKKVLIAEVSDILANCPDREKLGDEVANRVVGQLVRRVLDDIFTAENMGVLLEKTEELARAVVGKAVGQEQGTSAGNPGMAGAPVPSSADGSLAPAATP